MKINPINPTIKKVMDEFLNRDGIKVVITSLNNNGHTSVVAQNKNNITRYLFILKSDGTEITKSYYTDYIIEPIRTVQKNIGIVIKKGRRIVKKIVTEDYDPINISKNDNRPVLKKVIEQTIYPDGNDETVIKTFNRHYASFFERRN